MKLENILVSQAYQSPTNPRGKNFDGASFDDLVASVKEKGVLVPVIARLNKMGDKTYEILAGNRRFKAAQTIGLKEIPARVEEYNDSEAREVQIIENLQREDIHPLDEGESYRQLIEKSKCDIQNIAVKVGKSKSYIHQRLFLTNLTTVSAKAYRKGDILDGHAVLIAKLSPNDQKEAMKWIKEEWDMPTILELKDWVKSEFYDQLFFQPWLKNQKANKAVGKCKECPPNNATLFGEVKEGACTDLKCWNRKMENYIEFEIVEAKEKGEELIKVITGYGTGYGMDNRDKDILTSSKYELLGNKKKDCCEFAQKAIVCEDEDRGKIVWICKDKDCKKHGDSHSSATPYKPTKEEKESRKKEREKEVVKQAREEKKFLDTLDNIKLPMKDEMIDVLLEILFKDNGEMIYRPIGKRHEWEVVRVKDSDSPKGVMNWEKTIRRELKSMDNEKKFQLVVEIMLENIWDDKKILKMIK